MDRTPAPLPTPPVATPGAAQPVRAPGGTLGILMLDTRFPRPLGDVGNAQTFARQGIAVRYAVVRGATPQRVVVQADPALLALFVRAARELVDAGARMISTSCGFLGAHQSALADALPVPVFSSSLLQCARCERPGIVTIDAASLHPAILQSVRVPAATPVQGVARQCELRRRILNNDATLDVAQAERDVVAAAMQLVANHPQVREIVLECTNMGPYRAAVEHATGRRVLDLLTLLCDAWRSLT